MLKNKFMCYNQLILLISTKADKLIIYTVYSDEEASDDLTALWQGIRLKE